jgi:hypothetical protein
MQKTVNPELWTDDDKADLARCWKGAKTELTNVIGCIREFGYTVGLVQADELPGNVVCGIGFSFEFLARLADSIDAVRDDCEFHLSRAGAFPEQILDAIDKEQEPEEPPQEATAEN